MKYAITGSFDPVTNGHLELISSVQELGEVLVIIADNPSKQSRFSVEKRMSMLPDVEVVYAGRRYAQDVALTHGAARFARGVRSVKDYEYEVELARMNTRLKTVFIPSESSVSSSMVMGMIGFIGWTYEVKKLVPSETLKAIVHKYLDERADTFSVDFVIEEMWDRPYHNALHVCEVVTALEHMNYLDENTFRAALMHDLEYDATRQDNEERSAARFQGWDSVRQMVLATKNHFDHINETSIVKAFLDADLYILASAHYAEYSAGVRQEYSHLSDAEYSAGRSKFLKSMLEKDSLYYLEQNKHLNAIAFQNIKSELDSLSGV